MASKKMSGPRTIWQIFSYTKSRADQRQVLKLVQDICEEETAPGLLYKAITLREAVQKLRDEPERDQGPLGLTMEEMRHALLEAFMNSIRENPAGWSSFCIDALFFVFAHVGDVPKTPVEKRVFKDYLFVARGEVPNHRRVWGL